MTNPREPNRYNSVPSRPRVELTRTSLFLGLLLVLVTALLFSSYIIG
jgi:hypothetical protein